MTMPYGPFVFKWFAWCVPRVVVRFVAWRSAEQPHQQVWVRFLEGTAESYTILYCYKLVGSEPGRSKQPGGSFPSPKSVDFLIPTTPRLLACEENPSTPGPGSCTRSAAAR